MTGPTQNHAKYTIHPQEVYIWLSREKEHFRTPKDQPIEWLLDFFKGIQVHQKKPSIHCTCDSLGTPPKN